MSGRRDEVRALRERLAVGDWRAMLEPDAEALLTLALLDDAAWWGEAIGEIHGAIEGDLPGVASAELSLVLRDWCDAPRGSPQETAVMLRWCEAIVGASFHATEGHRLAIAAIRRCVP